MTNVPWIDWYQSLAKPSWTPAPRTIGLIWQILYPVIIATFGYVFVQAARGRLPPLVARHKETLEELVVYRQEYGDRSLWVRPAAMFAETIDVDGQTVPRFTFLGRD
jgi:hypothetical protein